MSDLIGPFTEFFTGADMAIVAALIFFLPSILLTRRVDGRFQRAFLYFLRIPSSSGLTGYQVALRLLEHSGVHHVEFTPQPQLRMRSHYDPLKRQIALANSVRTSTSVAALAIAAHEVGHAAQHARSGLFAFAQIVLVRVANGFFALAIATIVIGSLHSSAFLLVMSPGLLVIYLGYYAVKLPMEYDASTRARTLAVEAGLARPEEVDGINKVLRAAAHTYVARAVQTGWGILALVLMLGIRLFTVGLDDSAVSGDFSSWTTVFVVVLAYLVLFRRRITWPVGRRKMKAVERNNAANRLAGKGDLAGAINLYTQAIRLSPGLMSAYCNRGVRYFQLGRIDDALADLNQAVLLEPTAPEPRFVRARVHSNCKQYDAALADLDQVKRSMPENLAVVLVHQGNVRLDMEKYDQAIEAYTEALNQGGYPPAARSSRALAYLRQGNLYRALEDCDEAIRLGPEFAIGYNNRGAILIALGHYSKAQADLKTAHRLDPQLANVYKNAASLQATCVDPAFRDGAEAVANAKRAIQMAGFLGAEWLDVLAAAYAETGQFALAAETQEKFLSQCSATLQAEHQARLDLYRTGQPFRDYPSVEPVPRWEETPANPAITRRDSSITGMIGSELLPEGDGVRE